jgi:hypothetical protein
VSEGIRRRLEVVETQSGAHFPGRLEIVWIYGYTGRIGNAIVLREVSGNRGRSDHGCCAQPSLQGLAGSGQPVVIATDDRFGKFQ